MGAILDSGSLDGLQTFVFWFPVWTLIKSRYKLHHYKATEMSESSCCDMSYIAAKQYVKKVIYCAIFHLGVSSLARHVKNNFISAQTSQHPSFSSHLATSLCTSAFYWLLIVHLSYHVALIKLRLELVLGWMYYESVYSAHLRFNERGI